MSQVTMSATKQPDLGAAAAQNADGPAVSRAWAVFGVAISVRLALAMVFLGGADGVNSIGFMPNAAQHDYIGLPYFPLVPNWLGLAAVLDAHWLGWARTMHLPLTLVPPGLFPRLLPCLADSLVATWFALDTRHGARYRLVSSWAYAMCPLPLLLAGIQGQWDSAWILFVLPAIAIATRQESTTSSRRLAGTLLGIAMLVKPVPIVLLPFLLKRFGERTSLKKWLHDIRPVIIAVLATMAVAFSWFTLEGFDLPKNLRFVLGYSTTNQADVVFGLSHIAALNHFGDSTGVLRDVAILLALAVIVHYHIADRHTDSMTTAAAVLLILPAIGGIAPQYLLWPLPFMLAAGRLRLSVIYSSISTIVVAAYYSIGPESLFFVPVRSLKFLAFPHPAKHWLASSGPVAVWRPVSEVAVPIFLLTMAVILLRSSSKEEGRRSLVGGNRPWRSVPLNLAIAVLFVLAAIDYELGPYRDVARRLFTNQARQMHSYALRGFHSLLRVESGSWWLSALFILPLLTFAWSAVVWRLSRSEPEPAPDS